MILGDQKFYRGPDQAGRSEGTNPRILAIGDPDHWMRGCSTMNDYARMAYKKLRAMDRAEIAALAPDLVLSPIVATDFDCVDVAMLLADLDFRGAYRAVGRNVPKPDIVTREVRACCPKLDFGILMVDERGRFDL